MCGAKRHITFRFPKYLGKVVVFKEMQQVSSKTTCKTYRVIKPAFLHLRMWLKITLGFQAYCCRQMVLDPSLLVEVDTDPRPCPPPGRAPGRPLAAAGRGSGRRARSPPPPSSSLKFTFDFHTSTLSLRIDKDFD